MTLTVDQEFGIAAVRAIQEWLDAMPSDVPDRAAEALWETAQNSIEAIAAANDIASYMEDVREANPDLDDSTAEFWAAVEELASEANDEANDEASSD